MNPLSFLKKEPVMLGAALVAVYEASFPDASGAWKLAVGAVVAWIVRTLSTPNQRVTEKVEEAAAAAADKREVEVHADIGLLALEPPAKAGRAAKKTP